MQITRTRNERLNKHTFWKKLEDVDVLMGGDEVGCQLEHERELLEDPSANHLSHEGKVPVVFFRSFMPARKMYQVYIKSDVFRKYIVQASD